MVVFIGKASIGLHMKYPRSLWILPALALIGGSISLLMSSGWSIIDGTESETVAKPLVDNLSPVEVLSDSQVVTLGEEGSEKIAFPEYAVRGELVVQFTSREEYLAYLQSLADQGIDPLGQIDGLLAVRIPESALSRVNLGDYGARASFSHRIERPIPPVEVDPEALASLMGFGLSASAIVGEPVGGDGSGVVVAILDSGIQAHAQFDAVNIMETDLAGVGVDGDGAAHGTSVASIIAGREGIAPNSELFVVRVLDDMGEGNSYHVAEGIVQAVDSGAQIINMSLGVYYDTPLLRQAVHYADDRGVLMVAAAGNDAYDRMPYPAAYDSVLSVTAVDANGRQALFPNQSESIDFAAPGVAVLTAQEDQGTTLFSGTSAAAPFISGTLASLMSGDDGLASQAAVEVMQGYLNDQGAPNADPIYGAGVVDWDRIRERSSPDITDVALAGLYLPADAQPGTTMPIDVTVQNRGTTWFSKAELEVLVGDAEEPVTFTLGSLGPGQTTTRKVFTQMPAASTDEVLNVAARVLPEEVNLDVRLHNNIRAVTFQPAQ